MLPAGGFAKYISFTGNVYDGEWQKGVMQGIGKFVYINGMIFEGRFENNLMVDGKVTRETSVYTGQLKNNNADGWGTEIGVIKSADGLPNNYVYTGNWVEGKRSGQGGLIVNGCDSYMGRFENDTMIDKKIFYKKICKPVNF